MSSGPPREPKTEPPVSCPECAYSLAGLPPLAREHPCPECGFPASHFAPPEQWLRHADPAWLRRVTLGLWLSLFSQWWLLGVVMASLAAIVIGMIAELLVDLSVLDSIPSWPFDAAVVVAMVVGVGSHSLGSFLMSTPPVDARPPDARSRKFVRYCGVAFAPCCTIGAVVGALVGDLPEWALYTVAAVLMLNSICYLAAQPRWVRSLEWRTAAWRMDSPLRYRTARRSLWWMTGVAVILDVDWGWLFGYTGLEVSDELEGPQIWWLFMLIAFLVMTDAVTKHALRAVRGELQSTRGSPDAITRGP